MSRPGADPLRIDFFDLVNVSGLMDFSLPYLPYPDKVTDSRAKSGPKKLGSPLSGFARVRTHRPCGSFKGATNAQSTSFWSHSPLAASRIRDAGTVNP
jgi:hypothetical protein